MTFVQLAFIAIIGIGGLGGVVIVQAVTLVERGRTIRHLREMLVREYWTHNREVLRLQTRPAGYQYAAAQAPAYERKDGDPITWDRPGGDVFGEPLVGVHDQVIAARRPADPRLNKHSTLPAFYGDPSENPDRLDPPPSPMSAPQVPVHAVGDRTAELDAAIQSDFDQMTGKRMVGGERNSP